VGFPVLQTKKIAIAVKAKTPFMLKEPSLRSKRKEEF